MKITLYEVLAYDQYYPDPSNRVLLTASENEARKAEEQYKASRDYTDIRVIVLEVGQEYVKVLES